MYVCCRQKCSRRRMGGKEIHQNEMHKMNETNSPTGWSRVPGGMKDGKEMAAGTRIPPSQVVPLPGDNDVLLMIKKIVLVKVIRERWQLITTA